VIVDLHEAIDRTLFLGMAAGIAWAWRALRKRLRRLRDYDTAA
jgi:hypothetical protein